MNALSLFEAGRTAEAVDEARSVIAARKNISTAYLNLAYFHKEGGRRADAAAVLERGLESLPGNYYIFLEYITCLYEMGDYSAAVEVIEKNRRLRSNFDPAPWNYAGLSVAEKGRRVEGQAMLLKSPRHRRRFLGIVV